MIPYQLSTVGIQIPDLSSIQIAQRCPLTEWSFNEMLSENQTGYIQPLYRLSPKNN